MAVFYNQATISYGGTVRQSNIASGEILDAVSVTKSALIGTYAQGETLTYVVNIVNESGAPMTGLTLTDDLGAYEAGGQTVVPLTYVTGSLRVYSDGVEQPRPAVTEEPALTAEGIDLPADGAVTVVYAVKANEFAPLGTDPETGAPRSIVNTVSVTGGAIADAVTAQATVTAQDGPDLTVQKSITPTSVTENSRVTYGFEISNAGRETEPGDNVVLSDIFDPILTDLTVTLNGAVLTPGTDYAYDAATGTFSTNAGTLTVPGAAFSQDPATGVWTADPGTAVLEVTGTIGAQINPPVEKRR